MTLRPALSLAVLLPLLACKPDPAVVHRMAGEEAMGKLDFKGAAAEFAQSIALAPAQPIVWEKLAFCRLKAGDPEGAAEALVKHAELEPVVARRAEDFRNAAGIFLQGEDRAKAERFLLQAVKTDPNDESSLNWLGELASERGGARLQGAPPIPAELDKALEYYGRVIALRPDAMAAHANRRIVIVKYLPALDDVRAAQAARLKRAGKDAAAVADAKEQIARAEARQAELKQLLAESMAKLQPQRKPAAVPAVAK